MSALGSLSERGSSSVDCRPSLKRLNQLKVVERLQELSPKVLLPSMK